MTATVIILPVMRIEAPRAEVAKSDEREGVVVPLRATPIEPPADCEPITEIIMGEAD